MRPLPSPAARCLVALVLLLAASAALATPAAAAASCAFPVSTVDATGTSVTVDAEPTEVVTLAPSAAQTMWEIGARGKVVGVSPQASYLSGASSRTTVSTYPSVDAETVVKLDPDLVLAPNPIADEDVERLRSLGLTVYKFEEAETIEDVYAKTTLTGRLVGACDGAADTVSSMKATIREAKAALEGRERPPVFYHMGGGWTAGSDTFIDEIITTAGGENIAAAEFSGYRVLSSEVMIERDPHWFVRGSVPIPESSPYEDTSAGRDDRVIDVDANYLNQPGPRIVHPIKTIAETLHPEVTITISGDSGVNADLTTGSPSHTTRVTVDGALEVAVTGLYANRSYRVDLPADRGPNAGDGMDLDAVELALARPNPDFLLRVDDAGGDGPPAIDAADRRTLRRFTVSPNGLLPEDVETVTYRLRIPAGATGEADPADLSLHAYRSGSWTPLETTILSRDGGAVELVATAGAAGTVAVTAPAVDAGTPTSTTEATATAAAATGEDGNATPTATEVPATPTSTGTPTTAATTTGGTAAETSGQPGFGLVGAVAALAAACALRRRRGAP